MPSIRPFLLLVPLALIALPAYAGPDWAKVLEDSPGRLVLELAPPAPKMLPAHEGGPTRLSCAGCQAAQVAGSPDLPFHRFEVLSGQAAPQVTLQVLETESVPLPRGLASVPFQPTPKRMEYKPSAVLFASAGSLVPRFSGVRWFRGAPVRDIEIPLASWSVGSATATVARRMRVEITFPGVRSRPSGVRLPPDFKGGVLNPAGGPWLYEGTTPHLRRIAASGAAASFIGDRFIRIKIGDRTVESLSEDRFYALPFEDAARASVDIRGGIRISNLRLYTGANDTLPVRMDSLPSDPSGMKGILREIPMEVVDDGDSTFDSGDTLKFYAHGTSLWKRLPGDTGDVRYEFSIDPYSFENHYFLGYAGGVNPAPALRLAGDPGLSHEGLPLESTHHYLRSEQDRETASCDPSRLKDEETGFDWFWHWKGNCKSVNTPVTVSLSSSQLESAETDTLVDLVQGAADTVLVGFYSFRAAKDLIYRAYLAGRPDSLPLDSDLHGRHAAAGTYFSIVGPWPSAPRFKLDSLIWYGDAQRFEGYTVRYRRRHVFRGEPLWIFPEATGVRRTYRVEHENPALLSCLRIVDGVAVRRLAIDDKGRFTDSLPPDADARYLVHRQAARLPEAALAEDGVPARDAAIQDLITGDGRKPEYLIITSRALQAEAAKLRAYRDSSARALPLRTAVVHVEDIYRLFGSGRLSPPAIRDFLRWALHAWHTPGNVPATSSSSSPLKYVVLFGDGHYDFRGIHSARKGIKVPNIIPPYEFIRGDGYEEVASENFYASLEPGDNQMDSVLLDVAIGRVPVQTPIQAADYLEKIKAYESPGGLAGEWRGRVILAADDHLQRGSDNHDLDLIEDGHTTDSEGLGQTMVAQEPGLSLDRVNLLDYPINSSYRKPEASQDLLTFINRGSLLVNYVGHGSSNQWADEVLLQTSDALSRLQNRGRTGMVNAFSCTVGRFESLVGEGMSEQFVKLAGVGAIGAVSATRESYSRQNIDLARAFYRRVYHRDSATGMATTVGEALMNAKNSGEGEFFNDSKYALLGEPVLMLRKPLLKVAFTRAPDTLRALDCGRLEGKVAGGSGSGFVNVKVTAGSVLKKYELPGDMVTQFAERRGSILFERTFPYKDGRFSTEYFLPRQISFGDTNARISAFAWDGAREMEGSTAIVDMRIKGTGSSCPADTNGMGPSIRVTGCEKKETGGVDFPDRVTLPLPYCLQIQVEDSVGGVHSAEGPDEGTTVEVPGVLDPYHPQPGIDELYFKTYQLTLERKDFRPGPHVLKISAKDGYGNTGTRSLRMDLTLDSSIQTVTAYNIPNPMKRSGTAFYFSTVAPQAEVIVGFDGKAQGDSLSFEVKIFNQNGQMMKVLRDARSGVRWDGRDDWGNRAANGVYYYVVTARWNQVFSAPSPTYRTLSTRRNTLVISR